MISDINIRINRDLCYACGICVDRCIMDNLSLSAAPCRQECPNPQLAHRAGMSPPPRRQTTRTEVMTRQVPLRRRACYPRLGARRSCQLLQERQ